MMHFYKVVSTLFLSLFISQAAFAKWDEERDMTANGKEELVYYYKMNEQGQKLVLDKYVKRLIFIRPDRLYKRSIKQIKIDGVAVDVTSDPFSRYPEQTAIVFDNKDEVLKKLFLAKKIEFNVLYGRDEAVSVFQIK
ncbi:MULTISPECIES: hypothetical protein [unclassified Polynucleobacter]|jgi:hypothetical protein|uniref:hypothetical protein n=1 Tax=unclassified Polynucleobacter TaxID=2640945 RepID=UPI001C0E8A11|nr:MULTISPECIES: hypothetical protein [unclassified Polynucleobacter]MBU3546175.1 hypothetical protein [Polynucleobacter sp. MWH-Jannik1A5]BDT75981.1 hypothetical protein PKF022_16460 [Polynucleobacter sp. KF022]